LIDTTPHHDVFIIGGGINGCGLARDAAGRGFSVALAEMNDLGSGTSSASTKLIHGGLRYLEMYEFGMVRHALKERDVLLDIAPHLVRPLRFILPHHQGLRPRWLLRAGLFIYDHLGGRTHFAPTRAVDLSTCTPPRSTSNASAPSTVSNVPLHSPRLVIANARAARDLGARIMVRCRVKAARPENGKWRIELEDTYNRRSFAVTADFIANMGGPWAAQIVKDILHQPTSVCLRLVQGSHIVVPRLGNSAHAFIFQNRDGRIVFTIPYHDDYSLIGTTDRDYQGDLRDIRISAQEIEYLCASVSEYFAKPVTPDQVVWSYSGVRPLYDDGAQREQAITRDYVLKLEHGSEQPPYLSAFGGKLTIYRHLAQGAMEKIEQCLGRRGPPWTADKPLPGGDFSPEDFDARLDAYLADDPWLEQRTLKRLFSAYGTEIPEFCKRGEMGIHFGHGLYEAEVRWLIEQEWAQSAEDILWRRSKLGLYFDPAQIEQLENFCQQHINPAL